MGFDGPWVLEPGLRSFCGISDIKVWTANGWFRVTGAVSGSFSETRQKP